MPSRLSVSSSPIRALTDYLVVDGAVSLLTGVICLCRRVVPRHSVTAPLVSGGEIPIRRLRLGVVAQSKPAFTLHRRVSSQIRRRHRRHAFRSGMGEGLMRRRGKRSHGIGRVVAALFVQAGCVGSIVRGAGLVPSALASGGLLSAAHAAEEELWVSCRRHKGVGNRGWKEER